MSVEVSLWAVLLGIAVTLVSGAVIAGLGVLLKEALEATRREAAAKREAWRRLSRLQARQQAADRRHTETLVRAAEWQAVRGTGEQPALADASAVLADFPSRREPQAGDLERAQPLPAPALDAAELIATARPVVPGTLPDPLEVAAAHGQVRQRMDLPPWETAAEAYDVLGTDGDEPPRPNPLRPAAYALAELEPAPGPEPAPEPVRRDDEPPSGGRALTPFGVAPTTTAIGGLVVPRYRWDAPKLPPTHWGRGFMRSVRYVPVRILHAPRVQVRRRYPTWWPARRVWRRARTLLSRLRRQPGQHSYERRSTRSWSEVATERAARWERERRQQVLVTRWWLGEVTGARWAVILPQMRAALMQPPASFHPAEQRRAVAS